MNYNKSYLNKFSYGNYIADYNYGDNPYDYKKTPEVQQKPDAAVAAPEYTMDNTQLLLYIMIFVIIYCMIITAVTVKLLFNIINKPGNI